MTKQEFLAFNLPYGLKCERTFYDEEEMREENGIHILDGFDYEIYIDGGVFDLKPILRPLSDLTKEIEHNGEVFIPLVRLLENNSFDIASMELDDIREYEQSFRIVELITLNDLPLYLEWHFDLFGGIDSGEATDVNTLPENPYK